MRKLLLLLLILAIPVSSQAATLTTSAPASVAVGNIITARIVTNTQGKTINAAGGTLQFPVDLLEVVSVSKGGSVFSLWVEEPKYSNTAGTVAFDGGIPNPGYTGSGTILTVTFHAKRAGTATLSLADAAVRANDGYGTDILTSAGGTQITITTPTAGAPVTQPTAQPVPVTSPTSADSIGSLRSSTHPDQTLWYGRNDAMLSWMYPEGALAVQTIVSDRLSTVPTVLYQPAIAKKEITNLDEGISYFAIRAKTKRGWGPIATYTLQVDTTAPTLGSPAFSYDIATHELVVTNIDARDETSGIARYELSIDDRTPIIINPEKIQNGTYRQSYLVDGPTLLSAAASAPSSGGTHTVKLAVYDHAGNTTSALGAFVVPVALINQTLFSLFGFSVTLLWFLILMLLIALASLAAAFAAWYRLFVLRQSSRSKSLKREQTVHRALSLFRVDLEKHLKTLEHAGTARELTAEEEKLKMDMTENLSDLERYLKKEFKKFE